MSQIDITDKMLDQMAKDYVDGLGIDRMPNGSEDIQKFVKFLAEFAYKTGAVAMLTHLAKELNGFEVVVGEDDVLDEGVIS